MTWLLAGPPPDPAAAILRDVWIHKQGPTESLLLAVSDPDPENSSGMEHVALIPIDDQDLRRKWEIMLSGCLGKRLTELGALRLD